MRLEARSIIQSRSRATHRRAGPSKSCHHMRDLAQWLCSSRAAPHDVSFLWFSIHRDLRWMHARDLLSLQVLRLVFLSLVEGVSIELVHTLLSVPYVCWPAFGAYPHPQHPFHAIPDDSCCLDPPTNHGCIHLLHGAAEISLQCSFDPATSACAASGHFSLLYSRPSPTHSIHHQSDLSIDQIDRRTPSQASQRTAFYWIDSSCVSLFVC